MVRDRDCIFGARFVRRLRAMGIRDRPTAARSPLQNGHAERLIGSIRRECLDHVIVFDERHLRTLLHNYQNYYNECRTHLSLDKDALQSRVQFSLTAALPPSLFLADCIINIVQSEFSIGTAMPRS
jgi:transposase InsO family protein